MAKVKYMHLFISDGVGSNRKVIAMSTIMVLNVLNRGVMG